MEALGDVFFLESIYRKGENTVASCRRKKNFGAHLVMCSLQVRSLWEPIEVEAWAERRGGRDAEFTKSDVPSHGSQLNRRVEYRGPDCILWALGNKREND